MRLPYTVPPPCATSGAHPDTEPRQSHLDSRTRVTPTVHVCASLPHGDDADAWLVDIPKWLVAVDAPAGWHGGHLRTYSKPALPLRAGLSNDDFHVTAKCRQQAHESLDGILPKISS